MYRIHVIRDTIRVPPTDIGGNLKTTLLTQAKEIYEGLLDEDIGVVVATTKIENIGDGKIIPGDGAAYYAADISILVYKPEVQELVEGEVSNVTEFGAFLKTGPLEGLIHVSQIVDDYINYDAKMPGFIGKETKKRLTLKDVVLARTVTVSLKGTISSSKIGLTMRQEGLGKSEWKKIDEKKKKDTKSEKKTDDKKDKKGEAK